MYKKILLLLITCGTLITIDAQEHTMELTLGQTIERARRQSPDAQTAQHSFRSAYWNYKYYRANYLPALKLTSDPYLNRAINKITMSDGSVKFVEQNLLSTDLTLSLTQNIPWTGGTLFVETSAQRLDLFSDNSTSWQTSPINVGYSQSLFGYNSLKWNRRIEPLRYQEAKKTYVETLELVAANATQKFFALATAQSNYEIASTNYANADTLYTYAQGRYNIGTITENEMLQLELNKLTEETNRMNAHIEVENCMQELRSYLGIQEDILIKVDVSDHVPNLHIDLNTALITARQNSPDILDMQRRKLESESRVASARADFQHKLSRAIVDENQAVIVETLKTANMMKNHHLARAIGDAGWSGFITKLEYKATEKGVHLVKLDQWFASSKTCHCCGHKMSEMPLHKRIWQCPECGVEHDRDINAALNIKRRCEYFRPSHARFMAMAAVPSEATAKTAPIWEGDALYNRSASNGK